MPMKSGLALAELHVVQSGQLLQRDPEDLSLQLQALVELQKAPGVDRAEDSPMAEMEGDGSEELLFLLQGKNVEVAVGTMKLKPITLKSFGMILKRPHRDRLQTFLLLEYP